jgi:heptosyltransferase I
VIISLPDLNAVKRVLIIRLSSIGDVVHALPVSAALGKSFPHLELTWIVEDMAADVVQGNPYLHDVIVVPRQKWKAARRSPRLWGDYVRFLGDLRRRKFDVTLDLQGYGKSALMAWATGAPYRLGWWKMQDGAHFVSRPLPKQPDSLHRVDWFLDVPRALGAIASPAEFPLIIPNSARQRTAALLRENRIDSTQSYAVMNPATGDILRRWGAENYARVIRLIWQEHRLPTVLIGSGRDVELCEETARRAASFMPDEAMPRVLAGKTSVSELAALLETAAVVICSDTGAAHIAAALGTLVVGIYGPTDPAHAGPYGQLEWVVSEFGHCPAACTTRVCSLPLPAVMPADLDTAETIPNPGLPIFPASHCLYAITPERVAAQVSARLQHAASLRLREQELSAP